MTNKVFCVYIHKNKINGKVYIGQTCQVPEYRWNHGNGYKLSTQFYTAIQKYGWDNFEHQILYTNLSLEEANKIERDLIARYQSNNPKYGYNSDFGGNNKTPNEETKEKMRASAASRPIVTAETRKKISERMQGKYVSPETRNKMSIAAQIRESERNGKKFKKVKCLNTGEIFPSLRAAANWCGLAGVSGISIVCKGTGRQNYAGVHPATKEKLRWEYVEE